MDIALPHEGVAGRFEGGEAGNWDLAKKLEPLMTEPTVSVNIKYGPQKEVQDFARFGGHGSKAQFGRLTTLCENADVGRAG
jgi:hypothetical protein